MDLKVVGVVFQIAAVALTVWGFFLWRRHKRYAFLFWFPLLSSTAGVCGGLMMALFGVVESFDQMGRSDLDPAGRSAFLGEGISESTLAGLAIPAAMFALSLCLNLIFQFRRAPPQPPNKIEEVWRPSEPLSGVVEEPEASDSE